MSLQDREKRSPRLRRTEEIAQICDFEYNTLRFKYGGFFSVFQMEKIRRVLDEKQAEVDRLKKVIVELEADHEKAKQG